MAPRSRPSLIQAAKAAKEQAAAAPDAPPPAAPPSPSPVPQAAGTAGAGYITTAVHIPKEMLALLRRVAVERANRDGGRPSVSAVLTDLVQRSRADLEKETAR